MTAQHSPLLGSGLESLRRGILQLYLVMMNNNIYTSIATYVRIFDLYETVKW